VSNPVTPRFATAVHEASHAICALSWDLPVDRLSIRADGLVGICLFRFPSAAPEQVACILLAGLVGERLVAPDTDVSIARTDIAEAVKFLGGTDIRVLAARTRRRLTNLWTEVIRLAESLDKDGELVGVDFIKGVTRMPPLSWLN
jgi:hypothetical protein